MGKKILDSKILYVVLSVLISLSLWLWVTSRDENRESRPFNLPIAFEGVDILEERSLMLVNPGVTASITVRANPRILASLNENPIKLTANVSNISMEGTQRVAYSYSLPAGIDQSDVEVIARNGGGMAVEVEVARFLRRENVEIRGEFQGTAAEGYLPGDTEDFRFSPGTLTISGRAELVNQVAYAKVVVTGENRTESVNDSFPFQLIGASGDELKDLDVTCDVDTVYTVFPIRATAEIPLDIKVAEGGGLGREDVRLKLSARSITVAGSREAVAALSAEDGLLLGTIDLAALEDDMAENGGELTFPVPLADELENLSGITEVTVELKPLKRVETRTFDVATRISTTNVPEGWRADIITQVIPVKVRGPAELLDELTEENIQVVANLGEIRASSGQYTVPVVTYLYNANPATELGVVRANYTITVSLEPEG